MIRANINKIKLDFRRKELIIRHIKVPVNV